MTDERGETLVVSEEVVRELVKALDALVREYEDQLASDDPPCPFVLIRAAFAALRKARGESQ